MKDTLKDKKRPFAAPAIWSNMVCIRDKRGGDGGDQVGITEHAWARVDTGLGARLRGA